MREKCLSYIIGSRRDIKFYDKKYNSSYLREIAYPLEISEKELKKYIQKSFAREVCKLELHHPKICLIFYKNNIEGQEIEINGLIDKYWITGEIIDVEYINNNQKQNLEIAIDIELDKEIVYSEIKNILYDEHGSRRILFYESINECWIKRL
ncbi:hypothetical protein [Vagococcus fluvialis]|uniref:Uncharacterized protein n=1 Tax=Vagococcus fluvialis TaxID=2738 RepID=A0A7X6D9Q8_9ENTE|nr:hypothetical protein [Vagococcus fluvialis]NKC68414.1 hypothetical protein [Vagococcus fluvialis]